MKMWLKLALEEAPEVRDRLIPFVIADATGRDSLGYLDKFNDEEVIRLWKYFAMADTSNLDEEGIDHNTRKALRLEARAAAAEDPVVKRKLYEAAYHAHAGLARRAGMRASAQFALNLVPKVHFGEGQLLMPISPDELEVLKRIAERAPSRRNVSPDIAAAVKAIHPTEYDDGFTTRTTLRGARRQLSEHEQRIRDIINQRRLEAMQREADAASRPAGGP
jgi:hypothetical protein